VEHMVGCFAVFRGLVFLLKLSSHRVVFVVFCEVARVLAAYGVIR
jgi:hypothetical protein